MPVPPSSGFGFRDIPTGLLWFVSSLRLTLNPYISLFIIIIPNLFFFFPKFHIYHKEGVSEEVLEACDSVDKTLVRFFGTHN